MLLMGTLLLLLTILNMIKIRTGFFETNSSSTHCLTIWNEKWEIKKLYWVERYYSMSNWDNTFGTNSTPEEKLWILINYIYDVYPEKVENFIVKIENITGQSRNEIFKELYFENEYKNEWSCHKPYWISEEWLDSIYEKLEEFIFWDWIIETFPVGYDYSNEYNWEMNSVDFSWDNN